MAPKSSRKPRAPISIKPPPAIGGVRIRPKSRFLIVPSSPTEKQWLSLSNLDRIVNPTFSRVILFYENVINTDRRFETVTRSLKDSLAKVLVHFYPLAGRLALREDGLVDLLCNDEGAIFIEASIETSLSAAGGGKPLPSLSGLEVVRLGPGPHYIPDQLTSMPVLVIMVTKFNCGSIAIAVNWHHSVADGSSGCHFMKSWAEVATGKDPSTIPYHDRSLLRPRDLPDASLVRGYSTETVEGLLESCDVESVKRTLPKTKPKIESFYISQSAMQRLKEQARVPDADDRVFTTVETVSAYLWKQMTRVRVDDCEDYIAPRDLNTRFFMFVDGRKRLGMKSGFFGNVVCSACAVSTEEDILNKPLSYAANLIRKATRSISADYFRSLIDWVEIQGKVPSKSDHMNSLGHDVAATFWTTFPLYEIDFGWGQPGLAARNSPPRPLIDGIAMMPSATAHGDMVALLNLHTDRMDRITRLESFKELCS